MTKPEFGSEMTDVSLVLRDPLSQDQHQNKISQDHQEELEKGKVKKASPPNPEPQQDQLSRESETKVELGTYSMATSYFSST